MFSGGSNPPLPANDTHCRRNELNSPVYITIFDRSIVQMKFLDMGHIADVDELLEETDLLYKGMCELVVKKQNRRDIG